ncbi:uncharacterized protein LOC142226352 isoform X2 [Haematobia irritans]
MRCILCKTEKKLGETNIHYYSFPKDLLPVWCRNIRIEENRIAPSARICSRHFAAECFLKTKLRKGSIPTLLLVFECLFRSSLILPATLQSGNYSMGSLLEVSK